jgi:hypothetical protein
LRLDLLRLQPLEFAFESAAVLQFDHRAQVAVDQLALEAVERGADARAGRAQRVACLLDALHAARAVLLELPLELGDAPRLRGQLGRAAGSGAGALDLAQRVVHGHRQPRRVVRHRPEQDVVVEVLAPAQLVNAPHFVLVAQDHRAVRQRMHRVAEAVQTEVVLLGLLQRVEREHQHVRLAAFEVLDAARGVDRHRHVLELLGEQFADELAVGKRVARHQDACVPGLHRGAPVSSCRRPCQSCSHAITSSAGIGRAMK